MWKDIAEHMNVPWRTAEAVHWQMGEDEMARRAGERAFKLVTKERSPNSCHLGEHNPRDLQAPSEACVFRPQGTPSTPASMVTAFGYAYPQQEWRPWTIHR